MYNMKNKYIALGLVFGAGTGLYVGILTGNITIGLAIGAGIGLVFGTAIKNGSTLNNNNLSL